MPVASCSFLEAQFDAKPSQVIRTSLQLPSTSNYFPIGGNQRCHPSKDLVQNHLFFLLIIYLETAIVSALNLCFARPSFFSDSRPFL